MENEKYYIKPALQHFNGQESILFFSTYNREFLKIARMICKAEKVPVEYGRAEKCNLIRFGVFEIE